MSSGTERSIELRDLAVALAKARGIPHDGWFTWAETLDGSGFLPKDAGLLVQHWTPQIKSSQPRSYGVTVSIRDGETMKIVLDVEWAEDGGVRVMGYKPGEWEDRLLMIESH